MEFDKKKLYSVEGWNPKAFFRFINIDKQDDSIAIIATVKLGEVKRVPKDKLRVYVPAAKRNIHFRRGSQYRNRGGV